LISTANSEQQSFIKTQLDTIQKAERLSSSSSIELKALRDDITTLLSNLKIADDEDDSASSDDEAVNRPDDNKEVKGYVFESLETIMSSLNKLENALLTVPKETRVLQSLYFDYMYSREDAIDNPISGTFDWITMPGAKFDSYLSSWESSPNARQEETFEPNSQPKSSGFPKKRRLELNRDYAQRMSESRQAFRDWLTRKNGTFHISGKAGSGKSTLMKSILNSSHTIDCLKQWADSKKLVVASFFFWRSDRQRLQMTLDGLYRSILFEVLRKCPRLIPNLFPDQWKTMSAQRIHEPPDPSLFRPSTVKHAFAALMEYPIQPESFAFCFFIDGLDEYDAHAFEHRALARTESGGMVCKPKRQDLCQLSTGG